MLTTRLGNGDTTAIGEIFEGFAGMTLDYDRFFKDAVDKIRNEGRYRVFADLARECGRFPHARYFNAEGQPKAVTIWCSNDRLCKKRPLNLPNTAMVQVAGVKYRLLSWIPF
jgi:hypothetical protein